MNYKIHRRDLLVATIAGASTALFPQFAKYDFTSSAMAKSSDSEKLPQSLTRSFALVPFSDSKRPDDLKLSGQITRQGIMVQIHYILEGDLASIQVAEPTAHPMRLDELWQTTCFECFIGLRHASRYWEVNLSPAGHWNIYRFDDYRQGMAPENKFQMLPFLVNQKADKLELKLAIDLSELMGPFTALDIGITTVLETKAGDISYWALNHPAANADFHDRLGFTIPL